jgi:hypothetical protein
MPDPHRRSRPVLLVLLLSTVAPAATALAQPPPAPKPAPEDADTLIHDGLELRRQNQERAALPYFQRAYTLAPTPRAAAQLGFAEQALGMWVDAEKHLSEARAAASDPWVKEHRNLIDESAGFVRAHLGQLEVESNVTAADVLVDGRPVGRTPLPAPLRVPIGQRQVELRAASYRPAGRAVEVTTGETARVALQLIPVGGAPPPAAPAPPPPSGVDLRAEAPAPAPRPIYRRWELWAGVGTAVVLVGGAIILATRSGEKPFPCGVEGRVCAR